MQMLSGVSLQRGWCDMDRECEQGCRAACCMSEREAENEERCDEFERIDAEREAYHEAIDTEVDAQIEWLKGCGR